MLSSIRYILIAVALLAGALLVACGSDGDDNGDTGSDEPPAEQPDEGDHDDDEGSGDLSSLAERFGVTEVKIQYNMTSSGSGDDIDGTMTLYQKPPDRWRMDISSEDGDIIIIFNAGTSYMCFSESGNGQCLETPVGDATSAPFLDIFTDPDGIDAFLDTSGNVDVKSSREIAGQDADCFTFTGEIEASDGTGEVCFSNDGVLLLLRSEELGSGEQFALEATAVSDSVSDEDLEPPYDIEAIPGLDDILEDIPDAP